MPDSLIRCVIWQKNTTTTTQHAIGQPIYESKDKFEPVLNVMYHFYRYWTKNISNATGLDVSVCKIGAAPMRYDIDFVKAVYLGIDLPLRYIIPCCLLAFINIVLVVTVRKAQRHHSDISQTASTSLINTPVLRSALGIVFVFLICHTGSTGLFVLDVFRAFAKHNKGFLATSVNAFLEEDLATTGLEMKYSALLLAAINSSVNIVLYCFFLPHFRHQWRVYFLCSQEHKPAPKQEAMSDIPLEETVLPSTSVSCVTCAMLYQLVRLLYLTYYLWVQNVSHNCVLSHRISLRQSITRSLCKFPRNTLFAKRGVTHIHN